MRLQKQLLLLSLFTLTLPWVGCQYVREMDHSLKQGQIQSLTATALATAASLGSNRAIITEIKKLTSAENAPVFYAHKLITPPNLDGYYDDWVTQGFDFSPLPLIHLDSEKKQLNLPRIDYIAGTDNTTFNLFLKIEDRTIEYFNPTLKPGAQNDYVAFTLSAPAQERTFVALASAPGNINVYNLDAVNFQLQKIEPRIQAIWRETQTGYQLEIAIPKRWVNAISIKIYNATNQFSTDIDKFQVTELLPVVSQSPLLSNALKVFANNGVRLQIATNQYALAAKSGTPQDINNRHTNKTPHPIAAWLYSLALGEETLEKMDNPAKEGFFRTKEIKHALRGEIAAGRYQQGNTQIVRVASPVIDTINGNQVGAIVVEQNTDSLTKTTNSAFNRLMLYSVFVSMGAAFSLVIYASWLSIRIRKLSHAASNAISDSGKVTEHFPTFNSADEVGELSRNYAQLLSRLREYTNYLRTLSSKLSHELRTPLAIVKSSLDNLEHESLNRQARTYAERAKEGTTRLSNILNAMSAASRVEQAIASAEIEQLSCSELLHNLKGAYSDVYPHVRIELNIRPNNDNYTIRASGELLVQLLDKLIDNAADFCPDQGLIEIGLYKTNQHIVITVRNDGPPLPSHMQGQLFDSMVSVRNDKGGSKEGHHLGLGLYIVRLIVDFHQGEVQGYNIPDMSGVIFEVKLPIR